MSRSSKQAKRIGAYIESQAALGVPVKDIENAIKSTSIEQLEADAAAKAAAASAAAAAATAPSGTPSTPPPPVTPPVTPMPPIPELTSDPADAPIPSETPSPIPSEAPTFSKTYDYLTNLFTPTDLNNSIGNLTGIPPVNSTVLLDLDHTETYTGSPTPELTSGPADAPIPSETPSTTPSEVQTWWSTITYYWDGVFSHQSADTAITNTTDVNNSTFAILAVDTDILTPDYIEAKTEEHPCDMTLVNTMTRNNFLITPLTMIPTIDTPILPDLYSFFSNIGGSFNNLLGFSPSDVNTTEIYTGINYKQFNVNVTSRTCLDRIDYLGKMTPERLKSDINCFKQQFNSTQECIIHMWGLNTTDDSSTVSYIPKCDNHQGTTQFLCKAFENTCESIYDIDRKLYKQCHQEIKNRHHENTYLIERFYNDCNECAPNELVGHQYIVNAIYCGVSFDDTADLLIKEYGGI